MVFFWALVILIGMITADFFAPVLPSATLVTAAAGLVFGNPWLIAVLLVGAAGSSWFGEFMGYKVFRAVRVGLRRRPPRFLARLADRSVMRAVFRLEHLLERSVAKHPYRTTVIARFLPAGRTTLAWIAAGAGRAPYGRMAALGGVVWAVYTVGLGLVIAWIAGPGLQSLLGSVVTVLAVGAGLGWAARHWQQAHAAELEPVAPLAIAAGSDAGSAVGPEAGRLPGSGPVAAPAVERVRLVPFAKDGPGSADAAEAVAGPGGEPDLDAQGPARAALPPPL